jgi:hypothetical protein
MAVLCDISAGAVVVSDGVLLNCNGSTIDSIDILSLVRVTGRSSTNSISVNGSHVTLILSNISVNASAPLVIRGSSVMVLSDSEALLRSS